MDRVSPRSLLLDLLRVTPRPVPVRELVAVGELFGLEANAIRVALTRLVAAGLVSSDERGSYRLAAGADPVSRWVDGWRVGERRIRPWQGAWLCVWHPAGPRAQRGASGRALGRLGFGQGRDRLWVRPDNLRLPAREVEAELARHGLAGGAFLFVAGQIPDGVTDDWAGSLWAIEATAAAHRRALAQIERSRKRLARLERGQALVETFQVGGAAIRSLARDPLLPEAIAPGDERRSLTEAMLDYDRRGRAIWSQVLDLPAEAIAPSNLAEQGSGP